MNAQSRTADGADQKAPLHIVIAGHVDHGKSTLIGRLLHETDALPDGRMAELQAAALRRGTEVEWSFVLDAFQAERNQAITIDTTRVRFNTGQRDTVIVDAPGHREFLRNMISGAASCDAAVLVIDAEAGIEEQTRRHGYLLHLLGVQQIIVAVNKMDLAGYGQARFEALAAEARAFFAGFGHQPAAIIPVAARHGENLARRSAAMPWYAGPTFLEALDCLRGPADRAEEPLRLDIQDVYHFDGRRILAGRLRAGRLAPGDRILFSPGNSMARVRSLEAWPEGSAPDRVQAGDCVGLTLDQPLFVERGAVGSAPDSAPVLSPVFRGRVFWLADRVLRPGESLTMKLGTLQTRVTVEAVERLFDPQTLADSPAVELRRNDIADLVLRAPQMLALEGTGEAGSGPFDTRRASRFVLLDGLAVVGGGLASAAGFPDQRSNAGGRPADVHPISHALGPRDRALRNGHRGGVLWCTGLSAAGKSTLAMAAERALFERGFQIYVLDGDNVRSGLNADLGFSHPDRTENIRRVAEVAKLFADAGLIVISAFIAPYQADRERARAIIGDGFHEVFIRASLTACEARDPKGLYRKARTLALPAFTGISAPYEEPERPELIIDTESAASIAESVGELVAYAVTAFRD
jgi:bifunctional enzyme CysN/CysC